MSTTRQPEQINDVEQLQDYIQDLEGRISALHNARSTLFDELRDVKDELTRLNDRVDDLETQVKVTSASVPKQSQGKVKNVVAILEHTKNHGTKGKVGYAVDTGEVTAAIDGGRSTARRLMDDIGGRFEWANSENPGGPQPKRLKLAIVDKTVGELRDEVAEEYQ